MTQERASNTKIGPHKVNADGTELGFTEDAYVLSISPTTVDRMVHELGDTPHSKYITGYEITIACIFKEMTDVTLQHALDGLLPAAGVIDIDARPRAATQYEVQLEPLDASDDTETWTLWQATIQPAGAFPAFGINNDQGLAVTITALIEQNAASGFVRLLRFGDTTQAPVAGYDPT